MWPAGLAIRIVVFHTMTSVEQKLFGMSKMMPLFRAVVKFCNTNRLFTYFSFFHYRHVQNLSDILRLFGIWFANGGRYF